MGLNGSIEGSNPSFSASAAPAAVLRPPAEGWQSGRMRRSRKPLSVVRRIEGSNPSPSAPRPESDAGDRVAGVRGDAPRPGAKCTGTGARLAGRLRLHLGGPDRGRSLGPAGRGRRRAAPACVQPLLAIRTAPKRSVKCEGQLAETSPPAARVGRPQGLQRGQSSATVVPSAFSATR
jgi:hypothetical protein